MNNKPKISKSFLTLEPPKELLPALREAFKTDKYKDVKPIPSITKKKIINWVYVGHGWWCRNAGSIQYARYMAIADDGKIIGDWNDEQYSLKPVEFKIKDKNGVIGTISSWNEFEIWVEWVGGKKSVITNIDDFVFSQRFKFKGKYGKVGDF